MDIIIDFLIKKQEIESCRKWPKREKSVPAPPIYIGKAIYDKPTQSASTIHEVQEGYYYSVDRIVSGFNIKERYLYVHLYQQKEDGATLNHIWGYLLVDD